MSASQAAAAALSRASRWILPVRGRLKLNVDTAMVGDVARWSAGAVLRDDGDNFCVGHAVGFRGCCSIIFAEAIALRED